MKTFLYSLSAVALFACTSKTTVTTDIETSKKQLLSVDSAFSAMSEQKGMAVAFLSYADSNVVELNDGEYPTMGIRALADRLRNTENSKFVISWRPAKCEVAQSGELGYTFGMWRIDMALPNGSDTVTFGNYVSVWKKNASGDWKFVLDAGTSAPGPGIGEQLP